MKFEIQAMNRKTSKQQYIEASLHPRNIKTNRQKKKLTCERFSPECNCNLLYVSFGHVSVGIMLPVINKINSVNRRHWNSGVLNAMSLVSVHTCSIVVAFATIINTNHAVRLLFLDLKKLNVF